MLTKFLTTTALIALGNAVNLQRSDDSDCDGCSGQKLYDSVETQVVQELQAKAEEEARIAREAEEAAALEVKRAEEAAAAAAAEEKRRLEEELRIAREAEEAAAAEAKRAEEAAAAAKKEAEELERSKAAEAAAAAAAAKEAEELERRKAADCRVVKYDFYGGLDHGGDDIACYQEGQSADFCREKCDKDPNCKAYNYAYPNGAWGKKSGCCYKRAWYPMRNANKVDLYYKKAPSDYCKEREKTCKPSIWLSKTAAKEGETIEVSWDCLPQQEKYWYGLLIEGCVPATSGCTFPAWAYAYGRSGSAQFTIAKTHGGEWRKGEYNFKFFKNDPHYEQIGSDINFILQ